MVTWTPAAAASIAYAMPVFPLDASSNRFPGSSPRQSPSLRMARAVRSFTLPPGFSHSAFRYNRRLDSELKRQQRRVPHRAPERRLPVMCPVRLPHRLSPKQKTRPAGREDAPICELANFADDIPTSSWTSVSCFIRSASEMPASN